MAATSHSMSAAPRKPKTSMVINVNTGSLGERNGLTLYCADTNETFGQLLARIKKILHPAAEHCVGIVNRHYAYCQSEDKIFDLLNDGDWIGLSHAVDPNAKSYTVCVRYHFRIGGSMNHSDNDNIIIEHCELPSLTGAIVKQFLQRDGVNIAGKTLRYWHFSESGYALLTDETEFRPFERLRRYDIIIRIEDQVYFPGAF